jgi:hypothetical protein
MRRTVLVAVALVSAIGSVASADFVLFGNSKKPEVEPNNQFVHPITSPYYNEDSFVTSDVRLWAVYHDFANSSIINGGSAKVYAAQVRVALTDKLQLVAYKDGYVDFDSGLVQDSGWNDVAAGLKYAFLQDWENQMHAAVGIGYEAPIGSPGVFQNDDDIRAWVSFDKGFDAFHIGANASYLYSLSDEDEGALGSSDTLNWHIHADYWINEYVSPVVELNGYHVMNRGSEAVPFSGVDVATFGGGGDVITAGFGVEVRPIDNLGLRGAYELPITQDDDDLFGWRLTFSAVYSF